MVESRKVDPLDPPEDCRTLYVLSAGMGHRTATCLTLEGAKALAAAELETWRAYPAADDEDYPPIVERLEWVEGEETWGPRSRKHSSGRPAWRARYEGDWEFTITLDVAYP